MFDRECGSSTVNMIPVVLAVIVIFSSIASAQPTADSISVASATGENGQTIQVPVNITNVANGPLQVIMFDVSYDHSAIDILGVTTGDALPDTAFSEWSVSFGSDHESITLYTSDQSIALPNGSTGTIAVLWVNVTGMAGQLTDMNLTDIDVSSTGLEHGTIPTINGTFTVTGATYPTADSISVASATGENGQTIQVPVNITNVANGPLQVIMFDVSYDHSAIDILGVTTGDALPDTAFSEWSVSFGSDHESITLYTSDQSIALPNGSTGTIAVLWVNVTGMAGQLTDMNLTDIDVSSTGLEHGTIPTINGTFTVTGATYPTADSISVASATGENGQTIQVPVNITNVANGPLQVIMFDVSYDHSAIDILGVTTGDALPDTAFSEWSVSFGSDHESITLYTSDQSIALPNGSTGTIAVLWVNVTGMAGQLTDMNLTDIDVSSTGLEHGTIPTINGTFTVTGATYPTADSISVASATGENGQTIQVPVNITNVANGPLQVIMFDVSYDHSAIDILGVTTGDALPDTAFSEWSVSFGSDHESITLYTSDQSIALPNGSTGTIAVLWVNVTGMAGQLTDMNLTDIDVSSTGLEHGTIPTINGTFTVTGATYPTADSISVASATGENGQTIQVPVNITNVANGPLQVIMFDVSYDHSAIDILGVTTGDALPDTAFSEWSVSFGSDHESITLYTSDQSIALPNGSTGTIAVLWVNVTGMAGQLTDMNLTDIDVSSTGLEHGTIPTINGTFTVTGATYPTADSISVASATGENGQTIQVPVNITNVANGPLQVIMFDVSYDHSAIDILGVTTGDALPDTAFSEWSVSFGSDHESITLYTSDQSIALPNGSTGTIAVLWVNVTGMAGQLTDMNLTDIDVSSTGLEHGTIPTINGTFTVTGEVATTGDIIISEIMYAPTNTWGGSYNEWIELYNNDTKDINITGWEIDCKEISPGTVMQPGDCIIIARNDTKFAEYYAAACTVIKVTIGLPNTGETICLKDGSSSVVDSVDYTGYVDLAMNNNKTLERNATGGWEASIADGGTPCVR